MQVEICFSSVERIGHGILFDDCVFWLAVLHARSRAGEDDLAKELGDFVRAYHKKPEPKRAPGLLDKALDSEFPLNSPFHKGDGRMVLAHAFGHMARGHADLVRVYEAKVAKAQNRGRAFLLESLRLCGDEQTIKHLDGWREDPAYREQYAIIDETRRFLADPKRKLPRGRPAVGPEDIDLLWADFLVTGDYAPVARILDILDRPDGLRLRLEKWRMKHPEEEKNINEVLAWMKLVKPGTTGQLIDGNLELLPAAQLMPVRISHVLSVRCEYWPSDDFGGAAVGSRLA